MVHWMAAKRILQYLAGTKQHGITYRADATHLQRDNLVHGYANAAFANNENMHSTTGCIFTSYGGRGNNLGIEKTEFNSILINRSRIHNTFGSSMRSSMAQESIPRIEF